MSKRPHITLRERLRRLRDRANAQRQPPAHDPLLAPTASYHAHPQPAAQPPERPSGVYPVVKPQRAWLTMRRRNGNAV